MRPLAEVVTLLQPRAPLSKRMGGAAARRGVRGGAHHQAAMPNERTMAHTLSDALLKCLNRLR